MPLPPGIDVILGLDWMAETDCWLHPARKSIMFLKPKETRQVVACATDSVCDTCDDSCDEIECSRINYLQHLPITTSAVRTHHECGVFSLQTDLSATSQGVTQTLLTTVHKNTCDPEHAIDASNRTPLAMVQRLQGTKDDVDILAHISKHGLSKEAHKWVHSDYGVLAKHLIDQSQMQEVRTLWQDAIDARGSTTARLTIRRPRRHHQTQQRRGGVEMMTMYRSPAILSGRD